MCDFWTKDKSMNEYSIDKQESTLRVKKRFIYLFIFVYSPPKFQ